MTLMLSKMHKKNIRFACVRVNAKWSAYFSNSDTNKAPAIGHEITSNLFTFASLNNRRCVIVEARLLLLFANCRGLLARVSNTGKLFAVLEISKVQSVEFPCDHERN